MSTDQEKEFKIQRKAEIEKQGATSKIVAQSNDWLYQSTKFNYSYHFDWMGRPIIQYPQDIVAMQELIWNVQPDLIVETGIAHGGSLIFNASMLALLEYSSCCGEVGVTLDPMKPKRMVLGIDVDIRQHNRVEIESHPMTSRIHMIEGSSIDPQVVSQVEKFAESYKTILVILDSNHTHEHVLAELEAYAPLVSLNSYCVVFDTVIEDFPSNSFPNRPWGKGDNPKTAVWKYLENNSHFEIDSTITSKLLISVAPDGYLKRIK
tara:strand:+ start:760 stop:1548 length:789 start_codon:yes stop_codon:yes gene_type:complete